MSPRASIRHLVASIIALAGIGLVLSSAPGARAANGQKTCAQAVIDDWYGDSQVDKRYAPHCYREAIASLTPDQKDYLHAEEDILRALAYARAGKPDPGAAGALTGKTSTSVEPKTTPEPPTSTAPKPPTDTHVVANEVDANGAASVPLPLILLGGLAVTLLFAGGFGVVVAPASRLTGQQHRLTRRSGPKSLREDGPNG